MAFSARTLPNFGVPTEGGDRAGILMPKLKNRFRVLLQSFGSTQGTPLVVLSRQVQAVGKPKVTYEEQQVHAYNSRAYYAGKHEWQAITLSVRDEITNVVSKLANEQIQKQMDHFEQVAPRAGQNYKFTMNVQTLDGGNVVLEDWFLEGCFLTDVTYEDLAYDDTTPQMITMTVRYDNALLDGPTTGSEEGSSI